MTRRTPQQLPLDLSDAERNALRCAAADWERLTELHNPSPELLQGIATKWGIEPLTLRTYLDGLAAQENTTP